MSIMEQIEVFSGAEWTCFVTPAEAGAGLGGTGILPVILGQARSLSHQCIWIPAFAGMTPLHKLDHYQNKEWLLESD
jgi:hypothetical protein